MEAVGATRRVIGSCNTGLDQGSPIGLIEDVEGHEGVVPKSASPQAVTYKPQPSGTIPAETSTLSNARINLPIDSTLLQLLNDNLSSATIKTDPSQSISAQHEKTLQNSERKLKASRLSNGTSMESWMNPLLRCKVSCPCLCHNANRLRSPQCLSSVIGSVNADYSIGRCTSCSCAGAKYEFRLVKAHYIFPKWLTDRRRINLQIRNDINLTYTAQRLCPESAPLFWATRTGNIGHVLKLLKSGQASTLDIDRLEGKSAIHVGITLYNRTVDSNK